MLQKPLQEAQRFIDRLVCPFSKARAVLPVTSSFRPSADPFGPFPGQHWEGSAAVPRGRGIRTTVQSAGGGGIGRCRTGQGFSAFPTLGKATLSA